jgi:hypothetical protein
MRVYLDMCCLKRPFDDQSQARIRLESEAVLTLLAGGTSVEFVRGGALDLENDQNPLPQRAAKVRLWLASMPAAPAPTKAMENRTKELVALGFKNFDALHLASAEQLGAEVVSTCDDRFLAAAKRHDAVLKVRVTSPVDLAREVLS